MRITVAQLKELLQTLPDHFSVSTPKNLLYVYNTDDTYMGEVDFEQCTFNPVIVEAPPLGVFVSERAGSKERVG